MGHNNDSSTFRTYDCTSPNESSEVSFSEKDNSPLSMVDEIDKVSKSSDDIGNVYDGIQKNLEATGSDYVWRRYLSAPV